MGKFLQAFSGKEQVFVRLILFIAFLGHSLVSFHVSEGYNLHYNIFSSVNFFNLNVGNSLLVLGTFDAIVAVLYLLNIGLRFVAPIAIVYLLAVGVSGWIYFVKQTGHAIGIAELFRRVPWVFSIFFLWILNLKSQKHFYLLRIGIAFAFIAHGLASLGFFGLKGGHVELASKILTEEAASRFVYYSGISDTILGLMLIGGLLSRWAAIIGTLWLAFIVFLSLQVGLPEGLFRTGFFLMCLYVALDMRCHTWKYETVLINKQ
jgi:uncharacterized membrane protein YphA (DoxX/SURF4 family)